MVAPVEWVGSVREMVANGVDTFVEIGPGQVLSRLIRRISGDVKAISLNDAVVALLGPREESDGQITVAFATSIAATMSRVCLSSAVSW